MPEILEENKEAEKWESLTITNGFIFSKVFRKESICIKFLSSLLEKEIVKLDIVEYEKTVDNLVEMQRKT